MTKVYPNPFNDNLMITTNNFGETEFILRDISSRIILTKDFSNSTTLNTDELANGIYMYEIKNRQGYLLSRGKIVKQ